MEVGQGPNWGCSAKGKKTGIKIASLDMVICNEDVNS
jgi:hypothetical protein